MDLAGRIWPILKRHSVSLVLAALLLVCAVGWWTGRYPRSIVWGDVASWVTGLGTLVAVGISLYLASRAERDRRVGQARQISWWTTKLGVEEQAEPYPDDFSTGRRDPDEHGHSLIAVHFLNNSDAPVYSCVVKNGRGMVQQELRYVGTLPPGRRVFKDVMDFGESPSDFSRAQADLASAEALEWVEFADSFGKVWRRHAGGKLERVSKDPEPPHSM